jgi:hypothetical protein
MAVNDSTQTTITIDDVHVLITSVTNNTITAAAVVGLLVTNATLPVTSTIHKACMATAISTTAVTVATATVFSIATIFSNL